MTKPKHEIGLDPAKVDLQRLALEFKEVCNVQLHISNPHLTQTEINPLLRIFVLEFVKVIAKDMRIDARKYYKKYGHLYRNPN